MPSYDHDEVELLRLPAHERNSSISSTFQPLDLPPFDDDCFGTADLGEYELNSFSSYTEPKSTKPDGSTPLLAPDESTQQSENVFLSGNPRDGSATPTKGKRGPFFSGWRVGVASSACTAMAVLTLNVVLTIWASLAFPMNDGIGTLIDNDCNKSKSWALWLHIAINALSTILLAASNYTMQCLMAPTRRQLDKAHAKGSYLAVGVGGFRNMRSISWYRLTLFSLLIISSLPLHLMYNSAVFETLTARNYSVFVVSESFLQGGTYNESLPSYVWEGPEDGLDGYNGWVVDLFGPMVGQSPLVDLWTNITDLERLSPSDCLAAYTTEFVTNRGSLLAITNSSFVSSARNDSVYGWYQMEFAMITVDAAPNDPLAWICGGIEGYNAVNSTCSMTMAQGTASNWTVFNQTIEYCLSQPKDGQCTLEFSRVLMIVVITANAVKIICMVLALWDFSEEHPLVTIGDAAASFLACPDPTTKSLCMSTFEGPIQVTGKHTIDRSAKPFSRHRSLWFRAPRALRWTMTFLLFIAALIVSGALLGITVSKMQQTGSTSLTNLWTLGFGTINVRSLIQFSTGGGDTHVEPLLSMVLLANTPQIILSMLYFMYNNLATSMVAEDEWQRFSYERKPLRVTAPAGQQRSTYFLSLPYRYAIPLMVISILMHWLISQSIFLARVTILDENDVPIPADEITTCGWSSIAIVFVIVVGTVMLLVAFGMGFRRYKGFMPVAGGNSAIISAACHPHELDTNASVLPVRWGATDESEPGHCTLTSRFVSEPIPGHLYA
ncbi:hypothetical protein MMC13_002229 [Lambiella insularis]|nr:hypothetical protein [Lambiella insularis]